MLQEFWESAKRRLFMDKKAFICCICRQSFPSLRSLHIHIPKKEKISISDYYHLYYPRKDFLTEDFIEFKNFEQYFSSFFNSKDNMALWFQVNWDSDKAKELAKVILHLRIEQKELKAAPSQVELRTIAAPSISSCQKMFNYNEFCKSEGLIVKYKYGILDLKPAQDIKILIDTREQHPLEFKNSEVKKLDVGDYTAAEPFYSDTYIERKSIQDFYGTFYNPTNLERFKREMERAESYGFYVIVVVETTLGNCLNYKSFFVKDKNFVSHTFHNIRSLMQQFSNLQFAFSYNRFTAKNLITRILNQGASSKDFDWQFLIDTKQV